MLIKNYLNKKPMIHNEAYLADNCTIIGDVILEKDTSVWYNVVIRADAENITIKEGSNIQDGCVLHCDPNYPVIIEKGVSVGHNAILHGCKIDENTLVGMGCTIMNGATIGKNCIIGANALVPSNMNIPDNSLVMGIPAKIIRNVTEKEIISNHHNYSAYYDASKIELIKYNSLNIKNL